MRVRVLNVGGEILRVAQDDSGSGSSGQGDILGVAVSATGKR
ncbi:MAG: hypothetical protein ACYTEX_09605 [Planctomycetota bacterium]